MYLYNAFTGPKTKLLSLANSQYLDSCSVRASASTDESRAVTTYFTVDGPKNVVCSVVAHHIESLLADMLNSTAFYKFQSLVDHHFKRQRLSQ